MKNLLLSFLSRKKATTAFTSLLFLTLLFIGLGINMAYSQGGPFPVNPFRTTWITTDNTITIPTNGTGYNYIVTWTNLTNPTVGDGSATAQTGNYTITGLENNSTYEVAISGDFPRFYMNNNANEKLKLRTIREWGDIAWTSMNSAFAGCANLTYTATDSPNLLAVSSMNAMFRGCTSFDGNATINNWNTQNVVSMSWLFYEASSFNQPIGNWSTENVVDMSLLFYNGSSFNQDISSWNTENVTNMMGMFLNAPSFNQPIGSWNTDNVTNMEAMFGHASAFNQPIGNWNTSNVIEMRGIFENASVFNQPIGDWNIENVTNLSTAFDEAFAFNQPIGNWNTSNVTEMVALFGNATSFNQPIGNWNTQNVTKMTSMFSGATVFNQEIGNWNTENVTNMSGMFLNAYAFNKNIGTWNIESIVQNTNFDGMILMLAQCGIDIITYDAILAGWSAQNVQAGVHLEANGRVYCNSIYERETLINKGWTITGDFSVCRPFRTTWITTDNTITIPTNGTGYNYTVSWKNLTNAGVGNGTASNQTGNYTITGLENGSTYEIGIIGDFPHFYMINSPIEQPKIRTIEEWGSIGWTSMQNAFSGCSNLTYTATDIPNLSNVTNLRSMFSGCTSFDGNITMNNWITDNITSMANMFLGTNSFNQPIGNWNTENVTNMSGMFAGAIAFNQPIGNWNVENVTTMSSMFSRATAFNQSIENWSMNNVTDLEAMFYYASSFNHSLNNWNTSSVTNMSFMFSGAISFNQPLDNWNTSSVTDMNSLFDYTPVFNQPIGNWNTENVTNMANIFTDASAFNQNLGNWNIENVVQNGFYTGMYKMLDNSGLNTANYDATLTGWAAQNVNAGINLGAFGLTYCTAETARNTLTSAPNNWIITDDNLQCLSTVPFRTTWITTDGTITIPTNGTGYNYTITWTNLTNTGVGNGTATAQTGDYTITGLENNSRYEVAINGDFPHFYMNNSLTNAIKLKTIEEWGTNVWTSMRGAFNGCENLTYNATDNPNLSGVTDMSHMFADCTMFDGDIGNWNTSNVVDMFSMFFQALDFNQDLSNWNTENVTTMRAMFWRATSFNQDIGNWNTSSVIDMEGMFYLATSFNQDIGNWNTANVTNMAEMFGLAIAFNQNLGSWNIENIERGIFVYVGMDQMLNNSGLSTANYDATLTGWAAQNVAGITLGANGLKYCNAATARTTLTSAPNNWIITGDALLCSTSPEINIQGNGIDIVNNDTTPSTTDATDFGSVLACNSDTLTRIFTVQNTGFGDLTITSIAISGTDASAFSIGTFTSTIAPFSSDNFTVTFDASHIGIHTASIQIETNDADESPYTFAIQGTGTANNTSPIIPTLADITAQCQIVSLPSPTTTDNCVGIITATTLQVFPITTQGTTIVEWTFDDGNGNVVAANQNVVISTDTTIPTITAPTNVTANTDTGLCTASNVTLGTATGTDNCGTITFTNNAPTVFPTGLTTVMWTANDGNGNTSTATQTVTITTPVEINLKGNSVSIADGTSVASASNNTDFGDVTATRTITYTVENTGTQPLLISSITSSNPKFVVSNAPTSVSAAGTATFTVEFSSVTLGLETATITVNNNDCDEAVYDFAVKATKTSTTPPPTGGGTSGGTGTGGGTTGGTGTGGTVIPLDLVFTGASNVYNVNRVDLRWNTNSSVSAFRLYRNGVLIGTFSGSVINFSDANLAANTFYTYELVYVINGVTSAPAVFTFWTAPNPPAVSSITDVCGEGSATVKLSSTLNGTGNTYRVYAQQTGGSSLFESDTTLFNLPSVTSQTDFYISAVGAVSGKEGERRKVTVSIQPIFEAIILGESTKNSCTNSFVLKAAQIDNANSYTWILNGNVVGTGLAFTATVEGEYKVNIKRGVCEVLSESANVLLNQTPTAQIQESNAENRISFCENGNLNAISSGQNATYKWSLNGNVVGEEQNVAVSQSGNYTLLVSKNGCQASTTINVAVAPRPQMPTLSSTQDSICLGITTTLSVQNTQNGVTYKWLKNGSAISETGNSIEVNEAGNYTVEATSNVENSCTTISEAFQINSFEVIPTYLRTNQQRGTLYLQTATQNQLVNIEWYFEGQLKTDLGTTSEIKPTQEGNYYAIVTNQKGCSYQTEIVFVPLNVVTGQDDLNNDTFKIYPNPNNGTFKVHFGISLSESVQVSIFDGIGRKVQTTTFEKGNQDFNVHLTNQPKGMYLIHFNQNGATYSKQIVIE